MARGVEVHLRQSAVAGAVEVIESGGIAGLILSAGASRRMGTPKALLQYEGETFLDRLIRIFSAVCSPVVVVLGYHSQIIRQGLRPHAGVRFATNPDPDRGMFSSLQCGLAMIPPEMQAVMFTPVDHPDIAEDTVERLAGLFRSQAAPLTIPVYQREHGHPVCISRAVINHLTSLPVTANANDILHSYYENASFIEIADPGIVSDIDDPDAYRQLLSKARPRQTTTP